MSRQDLLGPMFEESEREFNRIWGIDQETAEVETESTTERDEVLEEKPRPINYASLGARKRKAADQNDHLYIDLPPTKQTKKHGKNAKLNNGLPSPSETDSDAAKTERLHPEISKPRTNPKPVYTQQQVINTSRYEPRRGDVETVKYVVTLTENCIAAHGRKEKLEAHINTLREQLHKMPFFAFLTPQLIKKSRILEDNKLSRIFSGPNASIFPFDVKADARALWNRWMNNDIDADLIHGILVIRRTQASGSTNTSYKLDPKFIRTKTPNMFGDNGLVNGQWWPLRICALRDGAHGAVEGGIHGNLKEPQTRGAYSIVIADGGYKDEDNGETIKYCSTAATPNPSGPTNPTDGTQLLLASLTSRMPIRVLRAVKRKSVWAPKCGIRYDGLYFIVDKEVLSEKTAFMRFSLQRMPGQDPIRNSGVTARPTVQEEREMARFKGLMA